MASPFTYEQMKARQRAENAKMLPAPPDVNAPEDQPAPGPDVPAVATDTTGTAAAGIDSTVLNTPALAPGDTLAPTPAVAESTRQATPHVAGDFTQAKRAVVLNALRNGPQGTEQYAQQLRRIYHVSRDFKATPEEVIAATFRVSQRRMPDLTPDEYVASIHRTLGTKVDKALLDQARTDYPGHKDEASLIDEMYKRKIAKEEAGPLTWADKAQIIARRYPELHKSDMEPEKALRTVYDVQKKKGKDVGSFDDWMHEQMAPTLAERGYSAAGGLLSALKEQGLSVVRAGTELSTPGQLASDVALATQAGDSEAGRAAKERLKETGMGAVNVAALAAAPAAKAGLAGLEAATGAAKTMPLLAGAAEGAVAGGVQGAGTAAAQGQPLSQIVQQGALGAGVGAGIGGPLEALHAAGVAKTAAAKDAAEAAAKAATEAAAARQESARLAEVMKGSSLAPSKYEAELVKFAREHNVTIEEARRAIEAPESSAWAPPTATVKEMKYMRGLAADAADARAAEALPPAGSAAPSAKAPPTGSTPTEAAPAAAAATAAPPEPGLVQSDVSERMTQALNRAQGQLSKRRAMIRQQLSQRLAAARERYGAVGGGLAGWREKLRMMSGEMKKPDWEGVASEFSDIKVGDLLDAIQASGMSEGDKLTAGNGLMRLWNGTKMGAPTLSQIRALRVAFGSEFADAAAQNTTQFQKFFRKTMQVLNTPRTMMTSLDLSAGMRQGYLMTSRPEYMRAWNTMRQAFGSQAVEDAAIAEIKNNPKFAVMRASGLKFQGDVAAKELLGAGERSEAFAGSLVDHWAGIHQSQRAYDTFINKLRADVFSNVYDEYAAAGVDVSDPHFRESLAHWINTGTGRGSLALLGRDAGILNALAFSPRLAWSRLETFNPGYYMSLHPAIARKAIEANLKTVGATMALLGVMAGSGLAKVGWDPRNSDFAKLKFGNTRLDVLGGHQQLARLFAQMVSGKVISSTTGREIDLNGSDDKNGFKRAGMTRLDVLSRFMEAKASPLASLAITLMRGQDFTGKPVSIPNEVLSRFTPMPIQDISDAVKETGWGAGLVAAPAALVGLGVQSYGPSMPASTGGPRDANYGVAMDAVHMGKRLWDHLNGIAPDREMKFVTPQLADQWVKDAAMAQVTGQQEATKDPHFFDSGFDQKSAIRKATARRMRGINKLYKDLAGGNGEAARLAAEKDMLQRRAQATGMDIEALRNPNIYREVSGK